MAVPPRAAQSKLVAFTAFDGVQMLDLVGPLEIFAAANEFVRRSGRSNQDFYRLEIVSLDGKPVRTSNGLKLEASHSLKWSPSSLDTLVVPGRLGMHGLLREKNLIPWIRKNASRARRVVSVCSGAFLLAEAGLLDGRRATTHWAGCDQLKKRHPSIRVEPDPIFVRDGAIYTSAGVTAGMDLALALIEEDLGQSIALELARWFVMFVKRPGGQAQFSVQLKGQVSSSPAIQKLLGWIAENLDQDLEVEKLARKAGQSPRHFARVFAREVGKAPASYVLEARLERARRELEDSPQGIKVVAARAGFGSEESLRRVFLRRLGVTPGEYRKRFQRRT